ncbi:MAG: nucleotidyltransferase [Verrucomicrobia bacterium]|nr:MAG: nucleotidyltransferase [Verrucomicrobiota bacterium]
MALTLLVMAAGMGKRYGGLKQVSTFGPNGEAILDYSIYDAIKAGFTKVIFVIRKEIEDEFKATIIKRISPHIKVDCVYQETYSFVPNEITISKDRIKPWGTGHAVLVAKDKIQGPFGVINADDFYGKTAFKVLADFLKSNSVHCCLVAYQLKNTLSEHGSVSRGICDIDSFGKLQSILEHTKILRDAQNNLLDCQANGKQVHLTGNEMVSLNLWGFQPHFFPYLEKKFYDFLKANVDNLDAEFYITSVIDSAIKEGIISVEVLETNEKWFGITYKEDSEFVKEAIKQKIASGEYIYSIWS